MKKLSLVLLIAVLATSFVFAATSFKGSAQLDLGYNFDNTDWGFANGKAAKVKLDLVLDSGKALSQGEGDLYGVIEASFDFKFNAGTHTDPNKKDIVTELTAKITKANIVYKKLVFGLLGAGGGYNYAASYYVDGDGDPISDKVALGKALAPGFTVSYEGYTGGFGAKGNAKAETYAFFGQAQTKEFALAEGMTVQAAGYGFLSDSSKQLGLSSKFAYAADKMKAGFAFDFTAKGKKALALEVAANFAFEPALVEVYYLTDDGEFKKHNLDAKVSASFTDPKATAYADFRDLVNDARTFEIGGDIEIDKALTVGASFGAPFKFTAFTLKANVAYKHEKFVAKAAAEFGMTKDNANKYQITAVTPTASITSKAIINNAELSLGWTGANFAPKAVSATGVTTDNSVAGGKVTASVKVSF